MRQYPIKKFFLRAKNFVNSQQPISQLHGHLSTSNNISNISIKSNIFCSFKAIFKIFSHTDIFFFAKIKKLKTFHQISIKVFINIKFKQRKTNALSFKAMASEESSFFAPLSGSILCYLSSFNEFSHLAVLICTPSKIMNIFAKKAEI